MATFKECKKNLMKFIKDEYNTLMSNTDLFEKNPHIKHEAAIWGHMYNGNKDKTMKAYKKLKDVNYSMIGLIMMEKKSISITDMPSNKYTNYSCEESVSAYKKMLETKIEHIDTFIKGCNVYCIWK